MKAHLLAIGIGLAVCGQGLTAAQELPAPPVAEKHPHQVRAPFGAVRDDEYYWLRDDTRKDPHVLAYLNAENRHTDAVMAPLQPLRDRLYREMVARTPPNQSSVPYLKNGYVYYSRFGTGADYPVLARRKGSMASPEEIVLDMPGLATGHAFFSATATEVSPSNRLLAFAEDTVGRRQYTLRVRDIVTGQFRGDDVSNIQPTLMWGDDNKTVFYVEKDPVTLLSKRVKAHVLGTPASQDRLVYDEPDDSMYIYLERTSDDRYLCIRSEGLLTSEQRCAPAGDPARFDVIVPREQGVVYKADHIDGRWIARTDKDAPNFRIATVSDARTRAGWADWTDLVPTSAAAFIENFKAFRNSVAIEERVDGNKRIRVLARNGRSIIPKADEAAYLMALSDDADFDQPWVRYTYESLITPQRTYEVNAVTGERRLLQAQTISGYDPSRYATRRVWATARDGTKVPVTLAFLRTVKQDGMAPLYQYAYGSYGVSADPRFSADVPSLLDRGVVYAIAHVRGGRDLGESWYEAGRLYRRTNTFTDFVDVTRFLVKSRYVARDRVIALGGSAGGTLMGVIANMAPQDYRVIIAQVPFVDAVTTMMDPTIPLVTNEYEIWGNPATKRDYDYILSWSPYDNVRAQNYPAMFIGTGLWDSQVQYYEPAKWTARLRALKTDKNPLVFRINMQGGHGGKSGRFGRFSDQAEYNAFALSQVGIRN